MDPIQEAADRLIKIFPADSDQIEFIDDRGDGHHFTLRVISDAFTGRTQIERQRMIYDELKDLITSNSIHALNMDLRTHAESGDEATIPTTAATSDNSQTDHPLYALVTKSPIMLFMKGDRFLPQCGFSAQIIEILDDHGITYETFDILEDEDVRQGLKDFSNWPTYPQLYINGQLIGGIDITRDLHEKGELEKMFDEIKKDYQ